MQHHLQTRLTSGRGDVDVGSSYVASATNTDNDHGPKVHVESLWRSRVWLSYSLTDHSSKSLAHQKALTTRGIGAAGPDIRAVPQFDQLGRRGTMLYTNEETYEAFGHQ